MKQLLLLLASGFICISAIAQNNNFPFTTPIAPLPAHKVASPAVVNVNNNKDNAGMRRRSYASTVAFSAWFDYWNQNATSTSTPYSYTTYPDSNLIDNTGSVSYNVYCHGLGMSFDPTDIHYYDSAATSPITDPPISDSQGYTIDSFRFPYEYAHYYSTAGADSVIVEFFVTTLATTQDSGDYTLIYNYSSSFLDITTDGTPRFATAIYTPAASVFGENECWDTITAQKQRYAFPLILTTSSTGIIYSTMEMRLTTPLVVLPGEKVISFIHFKSADSFATGTYATDANYMTLFAGTTGATSTTWPIQPASSAGYSGSYQTGLIAENQSRYGWPSTYPYDHHNVLIPGVAFSIPQLAVTEQAFHVKWVKFPPITGTSSICIGATTSLSDGATGGTWSSGSTAVATVSATGVVTGVAAGTAVISYTIGANSTTDTVTVFPTPTTPTFTGPGSVCTHQSINLTASETGGVWSSASTSIATVNSSGAVFGVSAGTVVISYNITNICGSAGGSTSIAVNTTPTVAAITGKDSVCPTVTLADATSGGAWASATPTTATVSTSGTVTGLSMGADVIWYIVSNTSCSDTAKLTVHVVCPEGITNVAANEDEKITVYPNPNEGTFNLLLTLPIDEQAMVKATNITGQVIKEYTVTTNKNETIQLDAPSGIYFLYVTISGHIYIEKITLIK